jgi:hypothetical protein
VLVVKLPPVGLYLAEMARFPALSARAGLVHTACPVLSRATPVQAAEIAAPSTVKSTVPTGVPTPGRTAATIAVNVTGCP